MASPSVASVAVNVIGQMEKHTLVRSDHIYLFAVSMPMGNKPGCGTTRNSWKSWYIIRFPSNGSGNEVFAKKIPWKSKRLVRKAWYSLAYANNKTEILTLVHSFESCTQDSSTVLAIIDDVFTQLKEIKQEINSLYLRHNNASCCHCASTLLSVHRVATKHWINLKRVDFSDPQGG